MTKKEATYNFLNSLAIDQEFTANEMNYQIKLRNRLYAHVGTYLRYLRYYREENDNNIICLSRKKSLYKKIKKT